MRDADEAEFHKFVSERMDPWRRIAYLLCQDWHEADDLVSIAVIKVYRNWSKVRRADNPDGYCRRILTHCWLTERRRAHMRWEQLSDTPVETGWTQPDQIVDRERLNATLRLLGSGQRAVLALRFYLDHSVEETAALLRISPGTVKSQTARGLSALRAAFDHTDH